jgi:hypothetical protein
MTVYVTGEDYCRTVNRARKCRSEEVKDRGSVRGRKSGVEVDPAQTRHWLHRLLESNCVYFNSYLLWTTYEALQILSFFINLTVLQCSSFAQTYTS